MACAAMVCYYVVQLDLFFAALWSVYTGATIAAIIVRRRQRGCPDASDE